jgi:hypothetical protein
MKSDIGPYRLIVEGAESQQDNEIPAGSGQVTVVDQYGEFP